MEREVVRAVDTMIALPLVGRTVGAGGEEPVEDGEEDRALDPELELAPAQVALDHAADPELAPEPFYHYGRADLRHGPGAEPPRLVSFDKPDFQRETREAFHDAVDVAFGLEPVEAPERRDDPLLDLPAFAEGLDDLEVLVGAGRLRADEHGQLLSGHDEYSRPMPLIKHSLHVPGDWEQIPWHYISGAAAPGPGGAGPRRPITALSHHKL